MLSVNHVTDQCKRTYIPETPELKATPWKNTEGRLEKLRRASFTPNSRMRRGSSTERKRLKSEKFIEAGVNCLLWISCVCFCFIHFSLFCTLKSVFQPRLVSSFEAVSWFSRAINHCPFVCCQEFPQQLSSPHLSDRCMCSTYSALQAHGAKCAVGACSVTWLHDVLWIKDDCTC